RIALRLRRRLDDVPVAARIGDLPLRAVLRARPRFLVIEHAPARDPVRLVVAVGAIVEERNRPEALDLVGIGRLLAALGRAQADAGELALGGLALAEPEELDGTLKAGLGVDGARGEVPGLGLAGRALQFGHQLVVILAE